MMLRLFGDVTVVLWAVTLTLFVFGAVLYVAADITQNERMHNAAQAVFVVSWASVALASASVVWYVAMKMLAAQ